VNRRAKIVCTLGPATSTAPALAELIDAGMNVARLNFSHGTHAEHSAVHDMVRQISAERARPVGVLADLQGPKIRLGWFAAGPVFWATGEHIVITTAECPGDHDRVSTTYEGLAADVRSGDRLLVDDGKVDLRVIEVDGDDITCEVLQGGRRVGRVDVADEPALQTLLPVRRRMTRTIDLVSFYQAGRMNAV